MLWLRESCDPGKAGGKKPRRNRKPVPQPPNIVEPADTPYPGTISLLVDGTNITDRVLNVQETIPIKGRDITLLFGYRFLFRWRDDSPLYAGVNFKRLDLSTGPVTSTQVLAAELLQMIWRTYSLKIGT